MGILKNEKRIVETPYICPKCGGKIDKVVYVFPTHTWHRWTCRECKRDYGANTPKPLI